MTVRPRGAICEIRTVFRAPIDFAYRWCTDYSPDDPALEKGAFQRRVLRKTKNVVVYEDLDSTPDGWQWSRWTVTLSPPHRWHGESIGNYRTWTVDYRLRSLPNDQTELRVKGRRTPTGLAGSGPSRAALEANIGEMWKDFRTALESDYRKHRK